MRNLLPSFFFLITVSLFSSCGKEEHYPVEPVITFKSIETVNKSEFKYVIGFTDGDGDIGFSEIDKITPPFNDESSIYYYNLYANISRKSNGVFKLLEFGRSPYNNRINDITPEERNKNIRGDITCAPIDIPLGSDFFENPVDTFRIEVFIFDRALHQSNTVTSPEFIMTRP